MAEIDTVRVAVRIRPLIKNEIEKGCQNIVKKINGTQQITLRNTDSYTFNHVFDQHEPQELLYNLAVKEMLPKLMKGYNVTILAYGQTGSGKTHTMGTTFNGIKDIDMGVIPRALYDIFDNVKEMSDDYKFTVSCSFMELYQEQLYDLLSTQSREQSIVDIREDGNKGIIIPGLTETIVKTAAETVLCLIKGSSGRAVGATAMNQESSRSHAIFTVIIQMMKNNDSQTSTTSKFHLVDLAGSERSKKTKATGDRFKEGVKINQGLLALGNVISALGTASQGTGYVGYRDSKLTRLLQDSLGGNSVTLMIACVSPADYNMDETLSTLRYADRARKIKNKPIVNQDPHIAEINRLNGIIQKLRLELLNAGGDSGSNTINNGTQSDNENMRKQINLLMEKNHNLQKQLQGTLQDVAELEMRIVVSETAHDKLQNKFDEFHKMFIDLNDNFNVQNCSTDAEKVNNIRKIIDEFDSIIRTNKVDILNQKLTESCNSIQETDLLNSVSEDVQQKLDDFTTKQIDFNNELRRINRELNLKEEHQQKVAGNLSKFCIYEGDNSETNIRECESKIQILENEKSDLLDKLKCIKDNASAKIAEERRKRLQQLEVELYDLRRKNLQQSKLLKVREKESQKILNLNSEIQLMKSAKVKLIRQMKAESENFRQWKLNREKQLTQLKEKDRKRQNELVRMESLHNKQKNVLKRKVEEAMAINKRLKDALDKQKVAQSMRKIGGTHTGKVDQVLTSIDHELEIVISVIDAQYSLEQLIEDRAVITNRLKGLKQLEPNNISEINTITEDLEMRNAQIDDLQQKICSTDIEKKMKIVCEGIQSMPEAKAALKHLFNAITELRREYNKVDEFKTACEVADDKILLLQKKYDISENKFREQISNIEKNYEEKITVLLRELNNIPQQISDENVMTPGMSERLKIQQETLDKLDLLREELSEYKLKCAEFEEIMRRRKDRFNCKSMNPKIQTLMLPEVGTESSDISMEEDDYDKDPDWQVVKSRNSKRKTSDETSRTSSTDEKHNSISNIDLKINAIKRNSDGSIRCNCSKMPCNTKRCKCRANQISCSENCGCSDSCINTKKHNDNNSNIKEELVDNKENSNTEINCDSTDIIEEYLTQTIDRTPTSTPNKKFKHTNGAENNEFDVTTPLYPFHLKKRQPFYEPLNK